MRNNKGSKMEPCGTPYLIVWISDFSLASSLEPLAHHQNIASLSLIAITLVDVLDELVQQPCSRGRSTCYSDRLHDFSVTIPRC